MVNSKNLKSKEKLMSILRERIANPATSSAAGPNLAEEQLSMLLGELQIFQLELEMQNDELSASYQMLEEEKAKFAGFFNLAPVGYFVLDHIGNVEEANQRGADLLGLSKEEVLHKRFQSFIDSDGWENFYAFLHKMQTRDEQQSVEMKLTIADKELYTRIEGKAVGNVFSGKSQYYVTLIDITDSRIDQQKFIDTTQRLEMTLSASGTGTWTMELGSNKLFLDDFCYSVLEIHQWEFDGSIRSFIDLIHPEDQQFVRQALINAAGDKNEVNFECRLLTKGGRVKVITAKGQQVSSGDTTSYFAGIIMDITEKKRLEQEALALQTERQRLVLSATFDAQEKERYKISNALHDSVCQLLYGIKINLQSVQLAEDKTLDFKNINQLLDQAIRETRELSYELTPSVLRDFGFAAGVREMAQRLSTPHFKVKTDIKKSANEFHTEVQLYVFRMIQELINNSIKHAAATEAVISVSSKNEEITLIVSDNGKGFQGDADTLLFKGSGLRAIKNRMFLLNGTMDVQSSGKGTTITLKFKSDNKPFRLLEN